MKHMNLIKTLFFFILLAVGVNSRAQVTIVSSDSLSCTSPCTWLKAIMVGDNPTDAGITIDDFFPTTPNPIGFTFYFYGLPYTQCLIGPNGNISFNTALAGTFTDWNITGPLLGNTTVLNTICGPWCDIDISPLPPSSGIVTFSTDGVAPNRKYSITYCSTHMFSCTSQFTTSQIVMFETSNIIEVHVAHKDICTTWNPSTPPGAGGRAIIGVQNAAGTDAVAAPGRDWTPVWSATNESWRFTPSGSTYTVASIPFSPIPLASSPILWYNVTTGAYLGIHDSINVCPTTTTTYKAGAMGCADTSFGFYTLTPNGGVAVTTTFTNPTQCGLCDGSIVFHGLTPGAIDTITYSLGGVPQPTLIATVSATGTITIDGLCAGSYTSIIVRQGACASSPMSVTISDPTISISGGNTISPTLCGLCNGSLILHGLYPTHAYTLTYTYNSVPQPAISTSSNAAGDIVLTGLCAGTYSNIIASYGTCITPPAGPFALTDPPISITSVTTTNPSLCGLCDGSMVLHGLYPTHAFTVTFSLGGVPQPAVTATSSATGDIVLPGLCAGTYTNIIASFGSCATPPRGPYTLVNPPISISTVDPVNATFCGVCDGRLTLHGLYPSHTFTVTFDFSGTPQPPVATSSNASGDIILTGLCEGTYNNIVASFGACVTPPVGPFFISAPAPPLMNVIGSVNPTKCGHCDGIVRLKAIRPLSADSVFFNFNGSPHLPIPTTALPDSSITLYGLCEGAYSNFTVKTGNCVYTVVGTAALTAPPISIGFDTTIHWGCTKDTVFFTNSSAPSSELFYTWHFGDGTSDTVKNPKHAYSQGTYTVTLNVNNGICSKDSIMVITLDHPLEAIFTANPLMLCQNTPVTFTNTSIGTSPTYRWYFGNGAQDNVSDPVYAYKNSGTYTVSLVATDFIGCHDTTTSVITVDSIASIRLDVTDTIFCGGSYVTFTGKYTGIGNTGVTWSFGGDDSVLNINPLVRAFNPGTYTITATPHFRLCRDSSVSRVISVLPQPSLFLGPDTTICAGSAAVLLSDRSNASNPGAKWKWNTGSTASSITIVAPDKYWATVNINSCIASDTVVVGDDCFIHIPNVFSPNDDGLNDYFFPRTLLSSGLISFHMTIFNRWGEMIFESRSLDGAGWNGFFKGVQQPQGVYVYVLDAVFKDGQKEHHQGNVTLIR
jgi:gliding motility-associated-like protein